MNNTNTGTESIFVRLKSDLPASIVVFLVALPLCMGVAIASGAPVSAGLISGIIGGIVVGALAGCPLQVSGPAAGLTVIVYEIIDRLGIDKLGLVVLVAGLLQFTAGSVRLGQWFRAVSPAVIKGMLAGIGLLILAGQFHVLIDDKPKGSGARNLLEIPETIRKAMQPLKLGSLDDRKAKAEALRDLREIAALQHAIGAKTKRTVDSHGPQTAPEIKLETLRPLQTEIETRLVKAVERFSTSTGSSKDSEIVRLRESAAVALLASREANESLNDESLSRDQVLDAVDKSRLSFTELESGMKNHPVAGALALATLIVIAAWQELAPKKWSMLPPALVAAVFATMTASAFHLPISYVDVPSNLLDQIRLPTLESLAAAPWMDVLQRGLLIAVVASAETLLCASAVDQLHSGSRTNYDRELWAQGIGNTLCGLFGALPMTGVIVRSSANVQAGGKTRLSAVLHGIWLLIFVGGLAAALRFIPTCCLAAILVYTGYKLIDAKAIAKLLPFGWSEVAIYAAVISVIVMEDLLSGVVLGIALSCLKLLVMFSSLKIEFAVETENPNERIMHLDGAATFIRLPKLAAAIEAIPPGTKLHIDLTNLDYIDHACLDLITTWSRRHEASGGTVILDWKSLESRFRRETRFVAQ